jgi:lysylphosphatidylglycerol synthetase-like protein (DUF2156 family)
MANILGVISAAAAIIALEVPGLIRKKLKGELWVFLGLLAIGVVLSFLIALEVDVPSPLEAIAFIYKPMGDIIFGMLER